MAPEAFATGSEVVAELVPQRGFDPLTAERERADVAKLLAEMAVAANAHDVDRHVGFYAHDPLVTLIFNGVPIVGWENIRQKQPINVGYRNVRWKLADVLAWRRLSPMGPEPVDHHPMERITKR